MYYQNKRRTVGSKKPFQQNPLSYCQWDRTVAMIHSALEPCISLFLPPFREETSFSYAQTYYPWVLVVIFFNPYYNSWLLHALLIRDILLTFQSGQKVAKTILFSPLVLFLCHGWWLRVLWLLLFREDHNGQNPHPEISYGSKIACSLYLVWGLGVFLRGEVWSPFSWILRPFYLTLVGLERQRASSDDKFVGKFRHIVSS